MSTVRFTHAAGSDWKMSGAYAIVGVTGTMAAGLAGAAPVFSFRWVPTTSGLRAIVDRIHVAVNSLGTGFTAGVGYLEAVAARAFTVADSDGAALTITTNNAKLDTGYATTELQEARIATTATITAGTRTLDAQPFGAVKFAVSTSTNAVQLATTDLWGPRPDRHPLVLSTGEGFIIRATVPATGTWNGVFGVEWREVS